MFRIASEHYFWWPVTVRRPDEDQPGKMTEETFTARFKALGAERADELDAAATAAGLSIFARVKITIKEVLVGWKDIVDDGRAEMPFSAEALNAAVQLPWFRDGVTKAYGEAVTGQEPRQGN